VLLETVLKLKAKSSEKCRNPEQRGRAQDAEMSVAEPRGWVKARWSKERVLDSLAVVPGNGNGDGTRVIDA